MTYTEFMQYEWWYTCMYKHCSLPEILHILRLEDLRNEKFRTKATWAFDIYKSVMSHTTRWGMPQTRIRQITDLHGAEKKHLSKFCRGVGQVWFLGSLEKIMRVESFFERIFVSKTCTGYHESRWPLHPGCYNALPPFSPFSLFTIVFSLAVRLPSIQLWSVFPCVNSWLAWRRTRQRKRTRKRRMKRGSSKNTCRSVVWGSIEFSVWARRQEDSSSWHCFSICYHCNFFPVCGLCLWLDAILMRTVQNQTGSIVNLQIDQRPPVQHLSALLVFSIGNLHLTYQTTHRHWKGEDAHWNPEKQFSVPVSHLPRCNSSPTPVSKSPSFCHDVCSKTLKP